MVETGWAMVVKGAAGPVVTDFQLCGIAWLATLRQGFRLGFTLTDRPLMLRTSQADRSQVIVASGIISALLAILLLMLAYQPW